MTQPNFFNLLVWLHRQVTLFYLIVSRHLSVKNVLLTLSFPVTFGNHSVTQSTFSSPCIPAHDTNVTINGFDSGFRDAGNSQAITNLPVVVQDSTTTIWFFDYNSCAQGGVGGININGSSTETLQGFQVRMSCTLVHVFLLKCL
jgi:hypothetical protein